MTLTLFIPVQHQFVVTGVWMGFVKAQTYAHVMWDGRVLAATLALNCLAVFMAAAMVKDWLVTAMTKLNGKEACVTYQSATTVWMANALLLVSASAIQDGQGLTVTNVFHWVGAISMEVIASTQTTQPLWFQMDASAKMVSLDICVMNHCATLHALKAMANASLEYQATSPNQFANAILDGTATLVQTALFTQTVQLELPTMVHAFSPTNASALVHQPALSVTSRIRATNITL